MDLDSLEPGQLVTDQVLLVADAKLLVDKRGQNYYSLTLNCEGGRQIEGKVWADSIAGPIEAGKGLEVLARVDEYRGRKQLNVQRYTVLDPAQYDLSGYVRAAEVDVDAAFETIFDWTGEEFANPWFKALMAHLHDKPGFAAQFKQSPAATFHHHNYQGGLVEHTLDVWRLAEGICAHYRDRLDRELVLCAVALHDLGKIRTYRLTAGVSERTEAGELLDHVFISASMVSNLWDTVVKPAVPEAQAGEAARSKAMLLHVILSHHGRMEWGSPVVPRLPEAVLVHHCDVISANLHACFEAIDRNPEGELWTEDVYIMDRKRPMFAPPRPRLEE
jgi:3'-5' exoribonuclease